MSLTVAINTMLHAECCKSAACPRCPAVMAWAMLEGQVRPIRTFFLATHIRVRLLEVDSDVSQVAGASTARRASRAAVRLLNLKERAADADGGRFCARSPLRSYTDPVLLPFTFLSTGVFNYSSLATL